MAVVLPQPSPTTFTYPNGLLIGNETSATNTGSDNIPGPTQVNHVNISALLELQSTTSGFVLPRMTGVQRDAIAVPTNGMMIYNTTTNTINAYENGAWGAGGGGDVEGPAVSTDNALPVFDGVTGKLIEATTVLLNPATSIISGLAGLIAGAGAAATPSYTFTGDTNSGMYQIDNDKIGFSCAGYTQLTLNLREEVVQVNHIDISGTSTGIAPIISSEGSDTHIGIIISSKGNKPIEFQTQDAGSLKAMISDAGIFSVGKALADATDTTATNNITLAVGAQPTGLANTLQIYNSVDGILGLNSPGATSASTDNTVNTKLKIRINGNDLYLMATSNPA